MAAQTVLPAQVLPSHSDQSNMHSFFKSFPRELRDSIYDLLHEKLEFNDDIYCPIPAPVMAFRAPLTALLLVSHQFKQQYQERFLERKDQGRLVVNQWRTDPLDLWLPVAIKCPQLATNFTTSLKINLWAVRSSWSDIFEQTRSREASAINPTNLTEYREWIIEFMTHLPHLRSVHITLELWFRGCRPEILRSLELITSIPKVVEVELRGANHKNISNEDDKSAVLATWTREQGLAQDDEALRRCLEKEWLANR